MAIFATIENVSALGAKMQINKKTNIYKYIMKRRERMDCFICSENALGFCFGMHCHLPYRRRSDFGSGSQMSVCPKAHGQFSNMHRKHI